MVGAANSTLYEHIHGRGRSALPWVHELDVRLPQCGGGQVKGGIAHLIPRLATRHRTRWTQVGRGQRDVERLGPVRVDVRDVGIQRKLLGILKRIAALYGACAAVADLHACKCASVCANMQVPTHVSTHTYQHTRPQIGVQVKV